VSLPIDSAVIWPGFPISLHVDFCITSGGNCPGGYCPGGIVWGELSGGYCPGGIVPGGIVSGGIVRDSTLTAAALSYY
jgi:hypothetical protein